MAAPGNGGPKPTELVRIYRVLVQTLVTHVQDHISKTPLNTITCATE